MAYEKSPAQRAIDWGKIIETALDMPGNVGNIYNRFYNYSYANQTLLWMQGAREPVATYKRWQALGRQVMNPRDAQRDENKQAINAPLQRKEGKRAAYRDIHRYKGSAKQHMVGERNEQAALILAYAAGRRPKPKEEAKVAGSPWMVTTRGEEVARRALRAKRSSQLSRQCARCDRVRTCELRVTERSSVSLAPIVTETVSLRTTLSHLRRI